MNDLRVERVKGRGVHAAAVVGGCSVFLSGKITGVRVVFFFLFSIFVVEKSVFSSEMSRLVFFFGQTKQIEQILV